MFIFHYLVCFSVLLVLLFILFFLLLSDLLLSDLLLSDLLLSDLLLSDLLSFPVLLFSPDPVEEELLFKELYASYTPLPIIIVATPPCNPFKTLSPKRLLIKTIGNNTIISQIKINHKLELTKSVN